MVTLFVGRNIKKLPCLASTSFGYMNCGFVMLHIGLLQGQPESVFDIMFTISKQPTLVVCEVANLLQVGVIGKRGMRPGLITCIDDNKFPCIMHEYIIQLTMGWRVLGALSFSPSHAVSLVEFFHKNWTVYVGLSRNLVMR